jgi:hypothetical protein
MATQPVKPSTNPRQGQGTNPVGGKPTNGPQKPASNPSKK